ncbi:GGDEF domain-containing protein [Hydrogenimonas sp.]|uniref:GGDEF domain-containing protein n=1 Tax=Hydrogenimonas sp. TaxID=2231112 RepID=UPI00261E5E3C|nr:GGDEF domain-containing protein [Hydrogenimonas sp.]
MGLTATGIRKLLLESTASSLVTTAETVRDCLTLHGHNESWETLETCTGVLRQDRHIISFWVARSQTLIGEYGETGFLTREADTIDRNVFEQGKPFVGDDGKFRISNLRISVPFIATSIEQPRCMRCHNAVEGDVLGTLSIEYDAGDITSGATLFVQNVALAMLVAVTVLFLILFYTIKPYRSVINALSNSLKKANEGDFSQTIPSDFPDSDIRELSDNYNRLLNVFQHSIDSIVKRFNLLIRDLDIQAKHPLERASKALHLLANVYRFRYAIEKDPSLFEVYNHIVAIVRDVTHAEHFSIYSVDRKEQIKTLIYSTASRSQDLSGDEAPLNDYIERIDIDEVAFEFPSMSIAGENKIAFYYCIPIDINEYSTIIIALFARNRDEMDRYRESVLELRYYLENVKPVIESKILTQKLKEQSLLDGLTGLYNRKFLEEFIDKIDNQAKRSQTKYAIMMIDIDFFKHVNDTYGHDVGDKFIKLLGLIIQDHIRASDIAVRYGGEEFLVLLHESTKEGAVKVAETMRKDFAKRTIYARGERIKKTISIGLSLYPDHTVTSLREAIKYADIALYRAKESGRNQVMLFSDEMIES